MPRGDRRHRSEGWSRRQVIAVLAVMVLLLPVPWLHVVSDDPLGTAWRLDGRLEIDGQAIDPPGRWSWLAVGRPQLLGEVVRDRLLGEPSAATDLRLGPTTRRPTLSEPAAVAVGLRHAGHELPLGVLVEVRRPLLDGYPQQGLLAAVNEAPLTDVGAWEDAASTWQDQREGPTTDPEWSAGTSEADPAEPVGSGLTFRFHGGQQYAAPGPDLPYAEIIVSPRAPDALSAGITFAAARLVPGDALRNLSVGSSHGMMVALMAYAHGSGHDLAQGRHLAGTGGVLADGTIRRIGGLPAKARAANRAGADVLLVPASQADQLEEVPLPGTTVVPVTSLTEAIDWLDAPIA